MDSKSCNYLSNFSIVCKTNCRGKSYDFNTDTKNKQNLTNHTRPLVVRQKQNTDSEIHIQRLYEGLRTRMYDYNIVLQLLRESYVSNKRNADKAFSLNQIALEIWDSPVNLFPYLNYLQMKTYYLFSVCKISKRRQMYGQYVQKQLDVNLNSYMYFL